MEIIEKVAYLKGLAEGMELDTEKKEGKLIAAIIDRLDDIGLELEDVEDVVFEDFDDDEDDEYYEDELDEDEDCYATTCPTCEETIYFDESILEDGEVICPNCGEKLEFDLTSLDEEPEDGEE